MTETRIKNATTGGEKGQKTERFDLIPARPMAKVARHYGIGAEKYEDRNWERGYDWSLSIGALERHLNAFKGGEDIDEETGSPHLAAVVFHALALLEFGQTHPELDDRVKAALGNGWVDVGYLVEDALLTDPYVPPVEHAVHSNFFPIPRPEEYGSHTTTWRWGSEWTPSRHHPVGRVSVNKIWTALTGGPGGSWLRLMDRVNVVQVLDALEDAGYEVTYQGTPPLSKKARRRRRKNEVLEAENAQLRERIGRISRRAARAEYETIMENVDLGLSSDTHIAIEDEVKQHLADSGILADDGNGMLVASEPVVVLSGDSATLLKNFLDEVAPHLQRMNENETNETNVSSKPSTTNETNGGNK